MADAEESVAVKTTVPAYQRDEWDQHADELGMSRSEFLRCMVQAGRHDLLEFDEAVSAAVDRATDDDSQGSDTGPTTVELTINVDGEGVSVDGG